MQNHTSTQISENRQYVPKKPKMKQAPPPLKSNYIKGHFLLSPFKMSYFRFGPIGWKLISVEAVCCQDYKKKLSYVLNQCFIAYKMQMKKFFAKCVKKKVEKLGFNNFGHCLL